MKTKLFLDKKEFSELSAPGQKQHLLKLAILEYIYRNGSASQLEISSSTGNSLPSINKIIQELIANNIIDDIGLGSSNGGRKPSIFAIRKDAFYILAIKMGREQSELAILNCYNELITDVAEVYVPTIKDPEIVETIHEKANHIIGSNNIDIEKIIGVGVALSGLIDKKTGVSYSNLNFSNTPINHIFEKKFNLPVYVDNDARVMAHGELIFGNAIGHKDALCIFMGSAIGMGIIINGRLYDGASGFAGEFGHIQIDGNGKLCHCGKKGCLETVAGGRALREVAQKMIRNGQESIINQWIDGDVYRINEELIVKAALSGDEFSIGLLDHIAEKLGKGMSNLIHVFNPEIIVLSGKLSVAEHLILDPLKQSLNKNTIGRILKETKITTSGISKHPALAGAVAMVMEKVLETPKCN